MSVSSVVGRGRVAAEARMTDACVIASGTPVWNPTTEQYVTTGTTVYAGPCRVKMRNAMSLEPDAGGTTGVVIRPEVDLPADTVGVEDGHTVTFPAAQFNPSLVGVALRVTSVARDSQATALRLDCTETQ